MNITTLLNDLQYIIDKKSRYMRYCKDEGKDCKALEIEFTTLINTKEQLEELTIKQYEIKRELDEAAATIKRAEQALLIAEAVQSEYNSAIRWHSPEYAAKLLGIMTTPKVFINQWKQEVEVIEITNRFAEAIEDRLNYFDDAQRKNYKQWCESSGIDYSKRERIWKEKTAKREAKSCQI